MKTEALKAELLCAGVLFALLTAGCASDGNLPDTSTVILEAKGVSDAMDAEFAEVSAVLGSHFSEFDRTSKGRANNIEVASNSIDQVVIQPGEIFSYNEAVGPTTKRNGYQLGKIFVNGKKSEGYGGGVCQVSSTLYNAAEKAGMEIVERHHHSLPVYYVAKGKDAATSYGVIDFKFKNTKNFPVMIESRVAGNRLDVDLVPVYGYYFAEKPAY